MIAVLTALAPIFAVVAIGYGLCQTGRMPDAFWPAAERLTYYLLFPSLLFATLIASGPDPAAAGPMAGGLAIGILSTAALMLALKRWLGLGGPAFSSVFQGAIRPNTYIGLAAALTLYGPSGVALIAICVAISIPLVNMLAIAMLARHGADGGPNIGRILLRIAGNPIILSVVAAIVVVRAGWSLPMAATETVAILGRAALPLGLLCVGAGLEFGALRRAGKAVGTAAAGKLLVTPAITGVACTALGAGSLETTAAVLFNALPTSASSYVLARQMGGDARLIAAIITATTILAAVTIPAILHAVVALI